MVFSGDPAMRRSDLLEVVSVLDVDTVLARAVRLGVERSGARAVVLARSQERPPQAYDGAAEAHDRLDELPLIVHGIDHEAAAMLRSRLDDAGLQGAPGARQEQDVARLRDPAGGREVLRVPVVVEGRLFADLLLLDPPEDRFGDEAVESVSVLGRVAGVAVRNALSYTLSERRRASLELAAAVDQSVRPPSGLSEPIHRIAEGALRIAEARSAAVVSAVDERIEVAATAGRVEESLPLLLDELSHQVRVAQEDGHAFTAHVDGAEVRGLALRCDHALAGVVVLVHDVARPRPTPADDELLESFVRHGSLVLDHAVLQQERQHAVLAADRDRIAQDLHDVVIQRLYATALNLRAGARTDDQHVAEAIRGIGDSIRDIRGTIFELERGRSASLRSDVLALAREWEPALGFAPVVRTSGPVDSLVGPQLAEQVAVVLRELLSNCARHAEAGRCEVDLSVGSGWLTLEVSDDGRGMSSDAGPRSGLRNLAARAAGMAGELHVEPGQLSGTRVRWRVPLEGQGASAPASPDATPTGPAFPAGPSTSDDGAPASSTDGSGQSQSEETVSTAQDSPRTSR